MRKRFWSRTVFVLAVCCSTLGVSGADGNPEKDASPFIVSSYIRASFYEIDRVSSESMNACTDLIFMACSPYPDGRLCFEIPDNQASFSGGAVYLKDAAGRTGVVSFDGTGVMNGGYDLLNTATAGVSQFSFGTWIYVDEWRCGGELFRKSAGIHNVSLTLGREAGGLRFSVDGSSADFAGTGLSEGGWHYVALSYNAKGSSPSFLYVDGKVHGFPENGGLKGKPVPFMQEEMFLGGGLKGKLDNTFFNSAALSASEVARLQRSDTLRYDSWRMSKTLSYWKYDKPDNPGEDSRTWAHVLRDIRSEVTSRKTMLRLGITSGAWKSMCESPEARKVFASALKDLIEKYSFDGVDLDFEWPANTEEGFRGYNETVRVVREEIGDAPVFSVSLHPISYKLSEEAVAALDFISIQAYGPRPVRFPYAQYVKDLQKVLEYGLPAKKLVAGVPFFGVESNGKLDTESYYAFVMQNLVKDSAQERAVCRGKEFLFDGQDAIRKKTRYALGLGLRGMMSWDLATDMPVTDRRSLLRAMNEEIEIGRQHSKK